MTNEYPLNVSEMTSLIDNGNRSGRQTAQSIPVEDKTVAESRALNRTKQNGQTYQAQDVNIGKKLTTETESKKTENDVNKEFISELKEKLMDVSLNKNWGVNFSIDQQLDKTVIKIVDSETQETIRQIPSDEMLELNKRLQSLQNGEDQMDNLAGIILSDRV